MKRGRVKWLLLLGVLMTTWSMGGFETVQSQSLNEMYEKGHFDRIDPISRSQAIQAERDRRYKVARQKFYEVKADVDEYDQTLEMINLWMNLKDLKYQNLQIKYVLRGHDLKLETEIEKIENKIVDKTKRLK